MDNLFLPVVDANLAMDTNVFALVGGAGSAPLFPAMIQIEDNLNTIVFHVMDLQDEASPVNRACASVCTRETLKRLCLHFKNNAALLKEVHDCKDTDGDIYFTWHVRTSLELLARLPLGFLDQQAPATATGASGTGVTLTKSSMVVRMAAKDNFLMDVSPDEILVNEMNQVGSLAIMQQTKSLKGQMPTGPESMGALQALTLAWSLKLSKTLMLTKRKHNFLIVYSLCTYINEYII